MMAFIPFMMAFSQFPMSIPTTPASLLWSLPVSLGIAVVYKAVKLEEFGWKLFCKEVSLLFLTIIGVLILTAIGLLVLARLVGLV